MLERGVAFGRRASGRGPAAAKAACRGPPQRSGRTPNMLLMSVTPDVFQSDMSTLMFVNSLKSPFMLVMAETSQSAIASYIVVAVVALASYSTSAVLS